MKVVTRSLLRPPLARRWRGVKYPAPLSLYLSLSLSLFSFTRFSLLPTSLPHLLFSPHLPPSSSSPLRYPPPLFTSLHFFLSSASPSPSVSPPLPLPFSSTSPFPALPYCLPYLLFWVLKLVGQNLDGSLRAKQSSENSLRSCYQMMPIFLQLDTVRRLGTQLTSSLPFPSLPSSLAPFPSSPLTLVASLLLPSTSSSSPRSQSATPSVALMYRVYIFQSDGRQTPV